MLLRIFLRCFVASAAVLATLTARAADLSVRVDARDVVGKRVHTQLTLAVKPGPLTLAYPKWLPGEHGPNGPLNSIIGLEIKAGGKPLAWTHDPLDMYALQVNVPSGVKQLEIALESGLPVHDSSFSSSRSSSAQLAILSWNQLILLPKGTNAADLSTAASVLAPVDWTVMCALPFKRTGASYELEPASLERLIDSPVQMGRYAVRFDLAGSAPEPALKHTLSIMADSPAALDVPVDFARSYERLVAEAGALWGARVYRHYTWLVSLSDHVAHFGLEHHESSDNRREEAALREPETRMSLAGLLTHEYVHSWNGKYRRPKGLLSGDFQQPMDGSLLWVYEGMTQFWTGFLATRAQLMSTEFAHDMLALTASYYLMQPGARWRPLADTAVQAQVLFNAPQAWSSSRRGADFYGASVFLWLDVDSELRAKSAGKYTIDDFVHKFYAAKSGTPQLATYVEQDLYDTLNTLVPNDWRGVIHRHLDSKGADQIRAALERSGWKLVYSADKNAALEGMQKARKYLDRSWSIGFRLDQDARVVDVLEDRAAARAGVAPGMTLIAINGKKYSNEGLDAALLLAQRTRKPIALLVTNNDYYRTIDVPYLDGPRYPHLVRDEKAPDTLSQVEAPRIAPAAPKQPQQQNEHENVREQRPQKP